MKVRWSGSAENYFLSFILVNNKLIGSSPNLYMLKLIINVSIRKSEKTDRPAYVFIAVGLRCDAKVGALVT